MSQKEVKRANFGSKLGAILAATGSAVGLGNIWRFPCEVGQNGGAAFVLLYLGCVFLLGFPIMLSEFVIGRRARANTMRAYLKLAPGTKWYWAGGMGVLAGVLILSYYSVVAGWTLDYLQGALVNRLSGQTPEGFVQLFDSFVSSPIRPTIWLIVFLLLTHFVIVLGVKQGIEKSAKIMMPLLFLILVVLCIRSLTLDGATEGLKFLFHPDFSKIDSSVVLSAMGQAFFSLSLGMGCLCTYASYFQDDTNLLKTGVQVTLLDTMVAVLAGVVIFPAAFAFGTSPEAGPKLLFVILPNIFQQMSGGYFWSILFYLLLVVAALTSTISLHEVVTAFVCEEWKLSRKKAALAVTLATILGGIICSLSFGLLSGYTIFDKNIFGLFDFLASNVMLPLGGLFISLFAGWYIDKKILKEELSNRGTLRLRMFEVYYFVLHYIVPVIIICIILNQIGIL